MLQLAVRCFSHACNGDLLSTEINFLLSCLLEYSFIYDLIRLESFTQQLVDDCANIVLKLLRKFPQECVVKVRPLARVLTEKTETARYLDTNTVENIKTINNLIDEHTATKTEDASSSRPRPHNDDDLPPEDFRELTTIPLESDLDINKQPFLRKNRLQGRYDNCDQYLDVQFRLLREDLFVPLRESISEYQSHCGNTSKTISSIQVYFNVKLIRPICTNNGLGYTVSFDAKRANNIKWESSKRLMYGSLLCLSKDNFQNCVYATVVNRDKKDISNGLLGIRFEFLDIEELNTFVLENRSHRFCMVESPSYYEPYKHVLQGMQHMNEANFPFYNYVVECDTNIQRPAYLKRNSGALYDLRPVVDPNFKIKPGTEINFDSEFSSLEYIDIQDDKCWPNPEKLKLDPSQAIALRQALNREFAIIQGPPGTGKTHVGLSILKVLLHNKSIWCPDDNNTPIVIICYTNHALDQFLLGALDFFDGNLVRVGSRSQDDRIKDYAITNHRTRSREGKKVSQAVHNSRVGLKDDMDLLKTEIEESAVKLQIAQRDILHEDFLKDEAIITDEIYVQLKDGKKTSILLKWLGIQQKINEIERKYHIDAYNIGNTTDNVEYDHDDYDEDLPDVWTQVVEREIDDDDDDTLPELNQLTRSIISKAQLLDVSSLDDISVDFGTAEERKLKVDKRSELRKLKRQLRLNISSDDCMNRMESLNIHNIWKQKYLQRWRLYRYWLNLFVEKLSGNIINREIAYENIATRYKTVLLAEDRDIIKEAGLVGLTTTAAAKYHSVLADIGPKIIIFEEAAEVLEGHIVVNLSRHCEHAIFIGDHKQLQPNPTVYKLAKQYNLDISLFERLINNKIPFDTLNKQHRMRPEIADIVRIVYPALEDHDVVKHYEDIKGVENNLAFINHSSPDETDEDTKSRANKYEADFIKSLCDYFLKKGYRQDQITILTTYSGQLAYFTDILPKTKYSKLRVATVDSYQGQENDIILLSLVRSSDEEKIGFLAKENRICVAFSRAKMGFFVIGNFEHLQTHSTLIKNMVMKASQKKVLHDGLKIYCLKHHDTRYVSLPSDFRECLETCGERLKCGHACLLPCHSKDEHDDYKCAEQCSRKCNAGHPCNKKCFEKCSPCTYQVMAILPSCGHEQMIACSEEPWMVQCRNNIKKTLPCGHEGEGVCSPNLTSYCNQTTKVTRSKCGHTSEVPCHEKDSDLCNFECEKILDCDHECSGTCTQCYKGRLHVSCQKPCGRELLCGHICKDSCTFCPPCDDVCINKCQHNRCINKCGEECIPCKMQCTWQCKHMKCTKRCSEMCDRERCNKPCKKLLPCDHFCIGLCGETCPNLCRLCNREDLEKLNIWGSEDISNSGYIMLEDCKHTLEVTGLDKYMDISDDNSDKQIAFKRCPFCKTHIISTPRYGNLIKTVFNSIYAIKNKIMGNSENIFKLQQLIEDKKRNVNLKVFISSIFDTKNFVQSENHLKAILNQIYIYEKILFMRNQLNRTKAQLQLHDDYFGREVQLLIDLERWTSVKRKIFSTQETKDAKLEIKRLWRLVQLCVGRERANGNSDVPPTVIVRLATTIREIHNGRSIPEEDVTELLEIVEEYIPRTTLGITDNERLEILHAIGGRKGEWYQCANGHYYSVGDCSRPLEKSICPECSHEIGGLNHALVGGNIPAPEFDDAEGPVHTEESDYLLALELQFG
ncbi:hypothetical protein LOTGIDRAFT_114003 [Lottia gigantea]|uniref:RZ-type domain-containing protein n=1 Tax=Lottia gigantea TaxID=225164 RepID=V4ANR5_LOTGI|nr:hypothetical protein LOTGIDRAFT_114003 [Lottia gigantea]ESO98812.1 hypothetical protein LOTGIDRAFT_114003 [Lottia gigantea]